ncbi:MAG: serpin family protein [Prevotellaceae bacterium]|jgi:serpin B|nr:serpin family protein [Prevotellaceae bacterium]
MKKYIDNILVITFCLFVASCDSKMTDDPFIKSEPIKIQLTSNEVLMKAENNNFSVDFFATLYDKIENKENIIVSPFSLSMALAMVWNGAETETKQEIQETLGLGNYPKEEVNAYFKKLNDALLKTDPNTQLAIANSIWTHKGFPVKQAFYDVNKTWYNAEARELDFFSPDAVTTINKWCADNTNNLIKEIIKEISPGEVMYLLNALYFKGIWSNKFDANQTQKQSFYKEDGTTVMADMMFQNHTLGYYGDEHLSLTALDYGNGAFSMVFALPYQDVSFDEMLNQLTQPDYFENCIQTGFNNICDVDLFIPKFKIEYKETLNDVLKLMGMELAFSDYADFSGISDISLKISKVLQKAYIDVNEKGTEAAAVTAVGGMATSVPPQPQKVTFRADRPFLFTIRENSTGTILFMGKVGNPVN